jgi:flagellar hook protein FlgE
MRLESALLASREGITSHGQAISVIGDNIANASTTGFKTSRTEFEDLMAEAPMDRQSEVVSGAGDGAGVATVRVVYESGLVEQTGRQLDVAINGNGFFMVGDAANPQFTRAGAFEIDQNGILTTSQGLPVLGYAGEGQAEISTINMYNVKTAGAVTTEMQVFGNVDGSGGTVVVPQNPLTFKDINQQAAFATTQTVYDNLGARHDVQLSFFKTAINTWTVQAHVDGKQTGGTPGQPVLLGQAELAFDGTGIIPDANKAAATLTGAANWANGAAASNFTIDLGAFTQYAGGSRVANFIQNGAGAGDITSYEFDADGGIFAVLDSGDRALVGRIPLATFNNNDGLTRSGSSTFAKTEKAGDTLVGAADTGSRGKLSGRALERSNADIASQFVEMVVMQRGYEANSQALSASNDLLKATIGLLR